MSYLCFMSRLEYQKKRRLQNGNADTKKYEKTPKGYLVRKYRNMKSRIEGIQWRKRHLYEGLEILDKNDFYEWALNNDNFWELFRKYKESGFQRKLAPSVDRIDSSKGYVLSNMRWLTHSENSRLGSINRHNQRNQHV